jgi:steroid delta-isomerase-like uncharacterized protein
MSDAVDVVRRVEDTYSSGDLDRLDELISDDFVAHTPGSDQIPPGRDGLRTLHRMSMESFPDRNVSIEDIFAEGDLVVVRCRMTGTNEGGMPWAGVPANHNRVDIEWIAMYRVADGRMVESWAQMDVPKMMQQLGVMPGPNA